MEKTVLQPKNNLERELPKEKFQELEEYIDSLEEREGALISVLHKAQELFGYLPRDVQLFVARKLGVPGAKVYGVVSFYNYFNDKPPGEVIINICTGTACFVKGADKIMADFEEKLGIKAGQTTEDGKFTLNAVRCVGACGLAPVVIVGEKVYGRVKVEELDQILAKHERKDVQ
ncbi:NADH-quinone oxidoreductase subunit NuoE [Anaerobranca gottschalkii]|uniref:NADH-quinone oxidoreductase subunit E n=1 Tax=Anaerobranca gottschalkii DSM 13577 TaxID=1120990 RepID=A0A1I0BZS1_9FIRM|nr:NADH-quinone oxidoreductase subunit NuoE [Anaerobranca gottschalkii]SET12705.1 NADH-quinone oxidoreductase subunit E [Anaerobranca gottschalkii DSM 13577]